MLKCFKIQQFWSNIFHSVIIIKKEMQTAFGRNFINIKILYSFPMKFASNTPNAILKFCNHYFKPRCSFLFSSMLS